MTGSLRHARTGTALRRAASAAPWILTSAGRRSRAAGRFRTGVRVGLGLSAVLIAVSPSAGRLARSWPVRAAVAGRSMAPLLLPGDWLLVDPDAYRARPPRTGELVVVRDPRDADRLLVKRVAGVTANGGLELVGDDPGHSTDSRAFGPADPAAVVGRPWARYWPPRRVGRVR